MKADGVRQKNWMMRIAAVLLVMVFVSMHMVSGLFARYTTSESGSDGARVAKFQINESLLDKGATVISSLKVGMVPGVPYEVEVAVKNASEVAVEYEIEVQQLSSNLPLRFWVLPDEGSVDLEQVVLDAQAAPYVFSRAIGPDTTKTYSLYLVWTPGSDAQAIADMGKVDMITLELSATQSD